MKILLFSLVQFVQTNQLSKSGKLSLTFLKGIFVVFTKESRDLGRDQPNYRMSVPNMANGGHRCLLSEN